MAAELKSSREHIVTAQAEERRRLRRELHDGLGPTLTGIAFTADAAANLIETDPAQSNELLTALRPDSRAALADVRRIVDDLRPPALDELGLVGALRQRAEQLAWRADGGAVGCGSTSRRGTGAAGRDRGGDVPDRHRGADQRGAALLGVDCCAGLRRPPRCRGPRRRAPDGAWTPGVGLQACGNARPSWEAGSRRVPHPQVDVCGPGSPRGHPVTDEGRSRVVVADDHPVVRAGLSALLSHSLASRWSASRPPGRRR